MRVVTCIHRVHMEDTTYIATEAYMFLTNLCATLPASTDPTRKIRRHITTEAYMFLTKSARRHLHPPTTHGRYEVTSQRTPICLLVQSVTLWIQSVNLWVQSVSLWVVGAFGVKV